MKLKLAVLAAATALLLTGCATIPQSGQVRVGPDLASGVNSDEVYYSQTGPAPGAESEAIIYGFLSAGNGPQNDYAVAREYLTGSLASSWKPNEEVLIQDGVPEITKVSENEFTVSIGVGAKVDADGHYIEQADGAKQVADYRLVKVANEWRISEAPNLTVINKSNFSVLFHQYSLYFYEPSLTYLVPEVRWFPSRASTGTRLINALLKGPSEWIKPAVVSIIPASTKLNINSVTVTNGVAAVDLSAAALKIPSAQKPLVKAQILATLEQLSDVSSVEISIQRTPQDIATRSDNQSSLIGNQPVILNDRGLFKVVGDGLQPINSTTTKLAGRNVSDFAYSERFNKLALSTPEGVALYALGTFDDQKRIVDARADLLAPAFDARGDLWTINAKAGARFIISGSVRRVLTNNWVSGVPVSFSLSPEGSRVAMAYLVGKTYRTYVFPIERDKAGNPVALGSPITIPSQASSISWASSVDLALLEADTVSLVTIGGRRLMSKTVFAAKTVVATGAGQLYVLDAAGLVNQSVGTTWVEVAVEAKALHLANR